MQSSFDKVILVHKCITKFPAYSRMQEIFNAFRDKRTKSKPILRYRTSPKVRQHYFKRGILHLLHLSAVGELCVPQATQAIYGACALS